MEDISRELEKELKAHSRPVPVKRKIKTELYFIDEIGKIATAAWIKPLVGLLAILTLFSTATAGVFVYLYANSGADRSDLARRVVAQEKRVQQLVSEKEILMARLVLSGNDSAVTVGALPTDASAKKGGDAVAKKNTKANSKGKMASGLKVAAAKPESAKKQGKAKPQSKAGKQKADPAAKAVKALPEKIGVEAIKVINDGSNGDLLVRFNIRNVAVGSNNVSGYIFVILKPDAESGNDWLVVPTTAMDHGRPAVYRKGQYFSIAHFKPVNFRVKTHLAPDSFKLATVFVYDDDGGLMFQRDMALAQ